MVKLPFFLFLFFFCSHSALASEPTNFDILSGTSTGTSIRDSAGAQRGESLEEEINRVQSKALIREPAGNENVAAAEKHKAEKEKIRRENASALKREMLLTKSAIILSIAILSFGLIMILLQVFVVLKKEDGWNDNCIRLMGITLVITTGSFLICAGFSEKQIAPMIGLLGTIVGYLLGRSGEKVIERKPATTSKQD